MSQFNTIEFDLGRGRLLGGRQRVPLGAATPGDYRMLLNVDTARPEGRRRMGGWKRPGAADGDPSNDDLHDQLLGGSYQYVDGIKSEIPARREAVTLIAEAMSFTGVNYLITGTKSRLYTATGQSKNHRLIADGLGGPIHDGQSLWPAIRPQMAQMGDYAIFTNNADPVLAWKLGSPVQDTGIYSEKRWAAFPIEELAAISVYRAATVAAWNGFVFVSSGSVVFWSDFNRPLEWVPTSQSLAGYFDFGGGEIITNMAPLGGAMRIYTNRAIYAVEAVTGSSVATFRFPERYRGDYSVAYPESFVNLGDAHAWLARDELVMVDEYDRAPKLLDWMHTAAGFIFDGCDGEILRSCPVNFAGFGGLDRTRCWQIAIGFDGVLGDLWISWPTTGGTDPTDFDGVRRMTLRLNVRYHRAALVDHGFSAFGTARLPRWKTVRDFMIEQRVCE